MIGCLFALGFLLLYAVAAPRTATRAILDLDRRALRISRWRRRAWAIELVAIRRVILRPDARGRYTLLVRLDDGSEVPLPIKLDAEGGYALGCQLWSALTDLRAHAPERL